MNIKQQKPKRIIVSLPTVRSDPYWRAQISAKVRTPEMVEETIEPKEGRRLTKTPLLPELSHQADRAAFLKSSIDPNAPQVYPDDELLLSLRSLLVNDLAMSTDLCQQKPTGHTIESMIADVIDNPGQHKAKAVILPLSDQGAYLTKKVRSLFGQLWLPSGMITIDNANDCLRALAEDYINQACFWNPEHVVCPSHLLCRTPRLDQTLAKFIPPLTLKLPDRLVDIRVLHEKFQTEVLGHLRAYVHDMVHKVLCGGTWNICFARRAPNGVIIMVGPDYRALDWERRMESGEWE